MTSRVPTGTELARPFLPAKDFDLSKHFYESLGFEKTLDDEVALFKAGSGRCVGGGGAKTQKSSTAVPRYFTDVGILCLQSPCVRVVIATEQVGHRR